MVEPDPRLRPARRDEARLLAEFAAEASSGVETYVWSRLRERADQSPLDVGTAFYATPGVPWGYDHVTIAEVDGRAAGMVHHFRMEADDEPSSDPVFAAFERLDALVVGHWYVSNMFVLPDLRGRGIGRRLLDHAVETAASAGCPAISLLVFAANAPAVGLYEANGFRRGASSEVPRSPSIFGSGALMVMTKGLAAD